MRLRRKKTLPNFKDYPSVLVIGGAGFFGSHLAEALVKKNCFVYCLDRLNKEKKENLKEIINKRNFHLLKIDEEKPLKKISRLDFDYIFHSGEGKSRFWAIREFLELAHKQKAKFLLLSTFLSSESRDKAEKLASGFFSRLHLDVRIVRPLDLYGPRMRFDDEGELDRLFLNLKEKTTFKVSGDGSQVLYPLYIKDGVKGLLKAMFSQDSKGKIYSLAGKEISILKFCQLIKKSSQRGLGVEFKSSEKIKADPLKKRAVLETQNQLNWQPQEKFKQGIEKTLLWLKDFASADEEEVKKKHPLLRRLVLIFIFVFLPLFMPLASLGYFYFQANRGLKTASHYLSVNELTKTSEKSDFSLENSEKGRNLLLNLSPLISFLHLEKPASRLDTFFDQAWHLAYVLDLSSQAVLKIDQLAAIIIRGEKGDIYTVKEELGFCLNQIRDHLNLIESSGGGTEWQVWKNNLVFERRKIDLAQNFIRILADFFAFEDKKTYLVLLQNNLELRPTGGFIGAYAYLTFEKGQLLDFQVEDSESVDRQLKGQVKPPEPITRYLGEKTWRFRDSNWDPHFPYTAERAGWFIEKALGRGVDGVIGLDLYFFQKLLRLIGPVELINNREFITAENIFERAEYYVPREATAKKDFLAQIAIQAFGKIKQMGKGEWFQFLGLLRQAMEDKDLLVSLTNINSARFFNQGGWDGGIRKIASQQTPLTDYLMIVEANLGANKVNYFLDREIVQQVSIAESGEIREKTAIAYQNKSISLHPPGGLYKSYLRFYLPLGVSEIQIRIGEDETDLKSLSQKEVEVFTEQAKQGLGFLLQLEPQKRQLIEVSYVLAEKLDLSKDKASYAFYWQKQPGMGEDSLSLQINYPVGLKAERFSPEAETSEGQLYFQTNTAKDRVFVIDFTKRE